MTGLILVYLIAILWVVLSFKTIMKISKYPYKMRMRKLIWTNLVIIFPIVGLIIYYLYGKQNLSEQ